MDSTGNPSDQRVARGDATRDRLIEAAITVFGTHGYNGVTTRELADAASVNQAAILYHFGGKRDLYLAVAEQIAARGRAAFAPLLALRSGTAGPVTAAQASAHLRLVVHTLVRGLIGFARDGGAVAFMLREQAQPGIGFDAVYDGYLKAVHEHVAWAIATATHRRISNAQVLIDAHSIIGMALGFAVARETFFRRSGKSGFTPTRVEQIATEVSELALRALGVDAPTVRGER